MNVLVVDGGGTKTQAWLVSAEMRTCLTTVRAGPSSPSAVSPEGVAATFAELAANLAPNALPKQVVLGLAGAGRKPEQLVALAAGRRVFTEAEIHVLTDAELAYRGVFRKGQPGILLIVGTGAIALYRTPISKEFSRAGGWGPLLGDEGGGAWFGREALRHCLLEWERDELGPLHTAILEALEIEEASQILTRVYKDKFGPRDWARLAPIVFNHTRDDPGALKILKNAAIELVALVEHLQETLAPDAQTLPLGVVGGIWNHRHHLQPLMEEEIRMRNLPVVFIEPVGGCLEGGLNYLQDIGRLK
ncbi:hypothetical protein KKH27_00090 [bacterium]|nr:hypothetical protein [bacterium]MBU1985458.1 hypothetical protein [bacterium]